MSLSVTMLNKSILLIKILHFNVKNSHTQTHQQTSLSLLNLTAKLQMLGEDYRAGTQLLVVKERNAEH